MTAPAKAKEENAALISLPSWRVVEVIEGLKRWEKKENKKERNRI